jgi:hypothetical protein
MIGEGLLYSGGAILPAGEVGEDSLYGKHGHGRPSQMSVSIARPCPYLWIGKIQ